jgi:hypothetical protein
MERAEVAMAVDYDILRRSSNTAEQLAQGMASFRQNQLLRMQQDEQARALEQQNRDAAYRDQLGQFLGQNTVNTLLPVAEQEQQAAVMQQQQNELLHLNPQVTLQALQQQAQVQETQRKAQFAQQQQQAVTIVQHAQSVQQSAAPATYVKVRYPDIYQQVVKDNPDADKWGHEEWRTAAASIEAEYSPQAGIDPYQGAFTVGETRYTASGKPIVTVVDELERKRLSLRDKELSQREKREQADENPTVNERTAQMIANYQMPPISPFAMVKPAGQALMSRVSELNPAYNGAEFPTRMKAYKDFSTGTQGKAVKSFNVAIAHLDTLSKLSDALENGDMKAINRVSNFFKEQTGKAAPTNFEAGKKIVADELVKAIVGSGGALADREETAKTVNAANSPAQLKGVIDTYQELMAGQLGGLGKQYSETTGRSDFDRYLSEEAKSVLERINSKPKESGGVASFATEAEAEAAGIAPGTKVIIGGVSGTWQ